MADKKISELDLALLINDDAEFPFSQDNAGEPTTFKGRITQLGTKIAEDMTFSNLRTTSKKLVGAINELLSLGSPIIIGTTEPTSSQGADSNIYVQYTAGTGGADDEVDAIFVKINGAWCEISTGGGSGTTDYEDLSNKPQVNSVELVGNKSLDDLGIMPASLSKTASGSLVHITDGADNIPVKSLVSQITAVESGSGEKSPDNPYTISGFDNGIITRCGKNLFDNSLMVNSKTTVIGDIVTLTATSNFQGSAYAFMPVKQGYKYALKIDSLTSGSGVEIRRYNASGTITNTVVITQSTIININDGTTVKISIVYGNRTAGAGTFILKGFNIALGENYQSYEAYNSNTYTFTFGQTVFGGHFDNKGNLVVTHGYIASYNGETINEPWISSIDEYVPNTSPSTGAQVVYPLTTPITLSITSQDIPTLLGENNIFSNCDDVEVDYYTDNADEIVEVAKATASTSLHNYSTDEQIVGTWIDGSTLYEKTQYGGVSIIEADTWYDTSITGIDKTVMVSGTLLRSGEEVGLGTSNSRWIVRNNTVKISLSDLSGDTWSLMSITVRYTKSST